MAFTIEVNKNTKNGKLGNGYTLVVGGMPEIGEP
jgi:hypothetical protein